MGRRRTIPVLTVGEFWDALTADYGLAGTYGFAIEETADFEGRRLAFFDEFNRSAEDVTVYTSGGDDGSFTQSSLANDPTAWRIATGAVINNDRYIHGGAVINNKWFSINEDGYTTVTWETRISFSSVASISAFWGLISLPRVDYIEYLGHCAHFLADPVITNTFRARSYAAAEEETDTLVALDTDWHTFRIEWTAASVLFYIDEVLVATHAAQVPTQPETSEFLIRTEAAAAKYMYTDYLRVEVT